MNAPKRDMASAPQGSAPAGWKHRVGAVVWVAIVGCLVYVTATLVISWLGDLGPYARGLLTVPAVLVGFLYLLFIAAGAAVIWNNELETDQPNHASDERAPKQGESS